MIFNCWYLLVGIFETICKYIELFNPLLNKASFCRFSIHSFGTYVKLHPESDLSSQRWFSVSTSFQRFLHCFRCILNIFLVQTHSLNSKSRIIKWKKFEHSIQIDYYQQGYLFPLLGIIWPCYPESDLGNQRWFSVSTSFQRFLHCFRCILNIFLVQI